MSFLLPLVAAGALLPAAPEKPAPLRYVRAEMGKYVTAGEVTTTRSDDGTALTVRSEGPGEKTTLRLHYDRDSKPTTAEVTHEVSKKSATLTFGEKGTGLMKRGGITDFLKDLPANAVVTGGPQWTDALQLVRRYDVAKGGKQDVVGLALDPVQGLQKQTYTVERQAADKVTVKDNEMKLDRFRIKQRGGELAAWVDGDGRVVRVQVVAPKAAPVVLDGFEDATRELKP
jgi:hypothetical protein